MLQVSGSISQTAAAVLAQHMREAGFTVDEQVMDWGTVLTRRGRKEGWSLYPVYSNGIDMVSPLTHFYIGSNCADYSGWSCDTVMTGLLTAYAKAPDEAVRKRIAVQIQEAAYRSVPAVMWGQFARPAGYRSRLTNLIPSSFPMFWNASLAS
jgi:peptide/nickel transport system substrate-binding protein